MPAVVIVPVADNVMSVAFSVNVTPVPATRLLKLKSVPTNDLNRFLPAPTFVAPVTVPVTLMLAFTNAFCELS